MLVLTKFLTWLVSPLAIAMVLGLLAWLQAYRGRRRRAILWLVLSAVWILVWSSPLFFIWFGGTLEREYPPLTAEETPAAQTPEQEAKGMDDDEFYVILNDIIKQKK